MKKLLSFLLVLALVMYAGSALAEKTNWVLAINATFPPFESIDETTAGFVGVDIDLANIIAEKLGVTMEIQDMQFSALVPTLQSGRADIIISGISPTAERKESLDFSDSYFFPMNAIICQKGAGLDTLDALKGKTIGVSMGTSYAKIAASVEGATVSEMDSTPLIIQEILNGRCESGIFDATQAAVFVLENEGLEMHTIESPVTMEDSFAIALPKGSPYTEQINAILKDMMADGTFHAILVKYLGEEATTQYEAFVKNLNLG
jgi:polar amino acid transport system substrate-binding protein